MSKSNKFNLLLIIITAICVTVVVADAADLFSQYNAHLQKRGFRYSAQTFFNGDVKADLVIDNGATFTIVSEKIANDLGADLSKAPRFPVESATGIEWIRLFVVDHMSIASANQKLMVVGVSKSPMEKVDGLAGMNYLQNYKYSINGRAAELKLVALYETGKTFGGYTIQWWRLKHERWSKIAKRFKRYLERAGAGPLKVREENIKTPIAFTYKDLAGISGFYDALLYRLDKEARKYGLPPGWRNAP